MNPKNAFLAFLVTAGSALTVLSQTTAIASLPPILVDVAATACIVGSAVISLQQLHAASRERMIGLTVARERRAVQRFGLLAAAIGVITVCAVICWNLRDPWLHLAQLSKTKHWRLCATVQSTCRKGQCLQLLDRKGRPVTTSCVPILDDSGLVRVEAETLLAYRPASIRTACGVGMDQKELPGTAFSAECDAIISVP